MKTKDRVVGNQRLNAEQWLVLGTTPGDPSAGPVFSTTAACAYCSAVLQRKSRVATSTIDLECPDCGSRFYADPTEEAALDTRNKLSGAQYFFDSPYHEVEAERRRKYRLARLAEYLIALPALPAQQRGLQFEAAMARLFLIEGLTFEPSFRLGQGEQVDGALALDGWYCLVECRWRERPARWQEVMTLQSQVRQSSRQTMGLFLSMNGWSSLAVTHLRRESQQGVLLVDGEDVRAVVTGACRLADSVRAKARHLALRGEPYFPVRIR